MAKTFKSAMRERATDGAMWGSFLLGGLLAWSVCRWSFAEFAAIQVFAMPTSFIIRAYLDARRTRVKDSPASPPPSAVDALADEALAEHQRGETLPIDCPTPDPRENQ